MTEPRIRLFWSKKQKDLMVAWDPNTSRATARYLMTDVLTQDVLDELDKRGFDVTTLRFQIRKKPATDA
jgi:hypothetical protein